MCGELKFNVGDRVRLLDATDYPAEVAEVVSKGVWETDDEVTLKFDNDPRDMNWYTQRTNLELIVPNERYIAKGVDDHKPLVAVYDERIITVHVGVAQSLTLKVSEADELYHALGQVL